MTLIEEEKIIVSISAQVLDKMLSRCETLRGPNLPKTAQVTVIILDRHHSQTVRSSTEDTAHSPCDTEKSGCNTDLGRHLPAG